jgi:hypothetical protein
LNITLPTELFKWGISLPANGRKPGKRPGTRDLSRFTVTSQKDLDDF